MFFNDRRRSTINKGRFLLPMAKQKFQTIDLNNFNALNYKAGETLQISKDHFRNKKLWRQTDNIFLNDVKKIKEDKNSVLTFKDKYFEQQRSPKQYQELHYLAKIHQRANTINTSSDKNFDDINEGDRCNCGCYRGKGKTLSPCTNEETISFLGPGVILHFYYIRSLAYLSFAVFLLYGLYSMITNLLGSQAYFNEECQKSQYCMLKLKLSDQNKEKNPLLHVIQDWLGLVFLVILWIFVLRIFKFSGKHKNKRIDSKLKSSSDTAIKISNLPFNSYEENQLISYLQDQWRNKRMQILSRYSLQTYEQQGLNLRQVVEKIKENPDRKIKDYEIQAIKLENLDFKSIQIIYDVSAVRKLIKQVIKYADQLKQYLTISDNDKTLRYLTEREKYLETKKNLISTYQILFDIRKRFVNDSKFRKQLSSTSCLLMFKNERAQKVYVKNKGVARVGLLKQMKMRIGDYFKSDEKKTLFKGKVLKIQRAPEPSDIIWQNCEKEESLVLKIFIFFVSILAIIISLLIQLLIEYLQNRFVPESDNTAANFVKSIMLLAINKIIWKVLDDLLAVERNHTQTQKIISKMHKAILLSTINAIATPIVTNYITGKNIEIYGEEGLAGMCFDYQTSVIVSNSFAFLDVQQIIKTIVLNIKCIRETIIRFISMKYEPPAEDMPIKSDPEVNKFYEKKYFDIASNYVSLVTNILHVAFFCRLQPIILFFAALSTFIFFITSRVSLYWFCKIPDMTEYLVFETALYILGYFPIVYGMGAIFLSFQQNQGTIMLIPSFISIFLGVIALSNPKDILNKGTSFFFKHLDLDFLDQAFQNENHETQQNEQSQLSIDSEQSSNTEQQQDINQREQSYYANSNVLDVFAFEKKIRGLETKQLTNQLLYYCQSFFEEAKINQGTLVNILNIGIANEVQRKKKEKACKKLEKEERKNAKRKSKERKFQQSGQNLIKKNKQS